MEAQGRGAYCTQVPGLTPVFALLASPGPEPAARRRAVHQVFDARPHPLPVRAFPEHPPADIAGDESRVALEHAVGHAAADFVGAARRNGALHIRHSRNGRTCWREPEPRGDFAQLRIGLQRAHIAAVDSVRRLSNSRSRVSTTRCSSRASARFRRRGSGCRSACRSPPAAAAARARRDGRRR